MIVVYNVCGLQCGVIDVAFKGFQYNVVYTLHFLKYNECGSQGWLVNCYFQNWYFKFRFDKGFLIHNKI